jgi:membrane protease YdiL (CAAX protease family)
MTQFVVVLGLIANMAAWRLVSRGRDVWRTLPPLLGVLGALSLLLLPEVAAPAPGGNDVPGPVGAGVIGAVAGIILYVGTLVFVGLAQHIPAFARQTAAAYRRAEAADPRRELVLSLLLAVPGEELFWRGLAYRSGAATAASAAAAAVAVCLLYVVANLPSRSLPIVAGAFVGGAVWGALAWWSGGVVAPLASHILWTGLMLARPPRAGHVEVEVHT